MATFPQRYLSPQKTFAQLFPANLTKRFAYLCGKNLCGPLHCQLSAVCVYFCYPPCLHPAVVLSRLSRRVTIAHMPVTLLHATSKKALNFDLYIYLFLQFSFCNCLLAWLCVHWLLSCPSFRLSCRTAAVVFVLMKNRVCQ